MQADSQSLPIMSALEHYFRHNAELITRGIEKEGLRATPLSEISQTDHPCSLGHPLTHSRITTDYSEALLELITPVSNSREALLNNLHNTHRFVLDNIGEELMWAGSMPCRINGNESIRIAEYGDSNIGILKHVYRRGLDVRYGRIMQSIAGLHYNFSLDDKFWTLLHERSESALNLKDFKSDRYFALTRNFRRYSWLLMYLFGASPALDESFLDGAKHALDSFDDKGTLYKKYATSLRMGDLGYHNNAQASLAICFNTLDNFNDTLGDAIETPYPAYEKIGLKKGHEFIQLNTNILQIENEYYSSIRPKRSAHSGEKPTQALRKRGVEYVEIRCVDLNPFEPLGISHAQCSFLDVFLLLCLHDDSPFLDDQTCKTLEENFSLVVNEGRRPNLMLKSNGENLALTDWATKLLDAMQPFAELLDAQQSDDSYQTALAAQRLTIDDVSLTPSAQVLNNMKAQNRSWLELGNQLSTAHKQTLLSSKTNMEALADLKKEQKNSLRQELKIKQQDTMDFSDFLAAYQAS